MNIPTRTSDRPLGTAGHILLKDRRRPHLQPIGPGEAKHLDVRGKELRRESVIKLAYAGVRNNWKFQTPAPDECLYSLTDARWKRIFHWPMGSERRLGDRAFARNLLSVMGAQSDTCKKCKIELPVILAHAKDQYGHQSKTWGIYCPFCFAFRKVRGDEKEKSLRL